LANVADQAQNPAGARDLPELLVAQADALAIPLIELAIPSACGNEFYEARRMGRP
jgi:hypothetical protein